MFSQIWFVLSILLVCFSSSLCIEYDKIVAIETVTADDMESGMDVGGGSFINLEVYGHYGGLECEIYRLLHAETMGQGDFAPGKTDRFDGSDLQACDGEEVTWYPGSVSKVRVTHAGDDGWGVKYVRVYFDDSSYITCGDGETVYVNGDQSADLMVW